MRRLIVKYAGECGKCSAERAVDSVAMYEKRTGPAAIEDVFQGQRPGAKQGTDEPDNDAEAFDVEW